VTPPRGALAGARPPRRALSRARRAGFEAEPVRRAVRSGAPARRASTDRRGVARPIRLAVLALAASFAGCALARPEAASPAAEVADGRYAMGTVLEVTLAAPDAAAGRALLERLYARTAALERELSSHDPASALSRLNARAGSAPAPVPPALAAILRESKALSRRTGGAFDVTVGPLVALWRAAAARGRPPSQAELAAARARVGAERVALEGGAVALAPGTAVELGGVAKGWTLDRLAEDLRAAGVSRALLSFGQSSVVALGAPPGGEAWRLLLRDAEGGFAGTIALRDQSLSVSESFGQWSAIGGRRVGHVLDPRSGLPLAQPRLAAVVAASGAEAEAWSKALLVLGAREGLARLATQPGVEALVVDAGGARAATPGFARAARFEARPMRPRTARLEARPMRPRAAGFEGRP